MLYKKAQFLKELVNKDLNVIGHNDDVDSAEEVKSNSTTDSHIDATAQQMGKNRTNALYSINLMNTGVLPVLEEDEVNEAIERIKNKLNEDFETQSEGIPSIDTLKNNSSISVSRNAMVLIDTIKSRGIDGISSAVLLNAIMEVVNLEQIPNNYKEILKNKLV